MESFNGAVLTWADVSKHAYWRVGNFWKKHPGDSTVIFHTGIYVRY